MQVFLPYPDFRRSLEVLDPKRLGNQVYCECLTLVRGGWPNHPVSKMWRGHHFTLCQYALIGLDVLHERGRDYPHHRRTFLKIQEHQDDTGLPSWFGNAEFHASHRSNLLRKLPEHYSKFGWSEPDNLPYVWPL